MLDAATVAQACGLSTVEQLATLAAGSQHATDLVTRFLAELEASAGARAAGGDAPILVAGSPEWPNGVCPRSCASRAPSSA